MKKSLLPLLLGLSFGLVVPAIAVPLSSASVEGTAGVDWSATFGVPYRTYSNGVIVGNGSLSPNPWGTVQPGGNYSVASSRPGFLGGEVSSVTRVKMGNFGALDPSNFFRYSTQIDINNPDGTYGSFGNGTVNSYFWFDTTGFNAFGTRTRVYWVAEWVISALRPTGALEFSTGVSLGGAPQFQGTLTQNQTGVFKTTWTGFKDLPEWNPVFNSETSFLQFDLSAGAFARNAPVDTQFIATVDLAFWDRPFDRIVRQSPSKAPDGGSALVLLSVALGALFLVARGRLSLPS